MGSQKYILKDKKIVPVDLMTWAEWFETAERHVGNDTVGDVQVSTVFLGLNHNLFGNGEPLLFETMIFGGKHDQYQDRCSTYEQAVKMHQKALRLVQGTDLATTNSETKQEAVKSAKESLEG